MKHRSWSILLPVLTSMLLAFPSWGASPKFNDGIDYTGTDNELVQITVGEMKAALAAAAQADIEKAARIKIEAQLVTLEAQDRKTVDAYEKLASDYASFRKVAIGIGVTEAIVILFLGFMAVLR